ncbi:hypothetical protein Q4534_20150 [Cyclobacterium sp. 1_MG-2023]|uniref:hypothetical protein n=1 Tax=Cyclobacterium sp. 1_MG-2023 TaxID=3062681 RepID=UPI0026E30857|nr:hypothetical protein [Cyclobacterium sp. 1_MG-2023]MDO6439750.1 hypothetical protein [Cyclobacterium sp. 1_MG-2023]
MEEELKKILMKDLEVLKNDPRFIEYNKAFMKWKEEQIYDYKKTKKSLKHIFRSQGLVLPKNWGELFYSWVLSVPIGSEVREIMASLPSERKVFELQPIPRNYFIEWAKEETQRLLGTDLIQKPEREKPLKDETNAVKYFLLDHFFKGNDEFNKLKFKDQENLLGFILSCRSDTVKHIKNNAYKEKPDGKYITIKSKDRFDELLEKLKMGEIL